MLLGDGGLKIGAFDPGVASALGNVANEAGARVLSEAQYHPRQAVLLRDWLYCLVKTPGTLLHRRFVASLGQNAEDFVETVEEALTDGSEEFTVFDPPLSARAVEPAVIEMLGRAEDLASRQGLDTISEACLTVALLESADESLVRTLTAWLGGEGQYRALVRRANQQCSETAGVIDLCTADGSLEIRHFRGSGRKLLDRLVEDAASIRATRISARHLLYTLLGDETSSLSRGLTLHGMDVTRDLHASLSRELCRPGRRRTEEPRLDSEHLTETTMKVLEEAKRCANERDGKILEPDVSLAFVRRQGRELSRLFTGSRSVDLVVLRETLEDAEINQDDGIDAPIQRLSIGEIEQRIRARIRGQDAAVARILPWIKRLRFGLPRDGRPAGVFLFLGPTGTGKTQMAKELARFVFGDEEKIIFLEMGQFKTKESMNMFIGAPPGYVGYGEGKLTNGLRDDPECVVLFDEVEKADTQVFDTLLRFADEGMISDPAGPMRDGRRCLIVMTTNAGQTWLRDELRQDPDLAAKPDFLASGLFEAAMREMATGGFRPEFLGRVDERVTFLPLTEATCREIVDQVLDRELRKFRELKDIEISVDESARDLLAGWAHQRSAEEGARGVPRTVNERIVTPVIDLLSGVGASATAEMVRITATARGLTDIELEVR